MKNSDSDLSEVHSPTAERKIKSKYSFDKTSVDMTISTNRNNDFSSEMMETQALLGGNIIETPSTDEYDHSDGHSKQPFLLAFLQSSIPHDIWDDIRNVTSSNEPVPSVYDKEGEIANDVGDGSKLTIELPGDESETVCASKVTTPTQV